MRFDDDPQTSKHIDAIAIEGQDRWWQSCIAIALAKMRLGGGTEEVQTGQCIATLALTLDGELAVDGQRYRRCAGVSRIVRVAVDELHIHVVDRLRKLNLRRVRPEHSP